MSTLYSEKRPYKYVENKKPEVERPREPPGRHGSTSLTLTPPFRNISPVMRAVQGTESHAFQELYWLTKSSWTAVPQNHIQEKVDINHQTTHYPANQRQT